MLSFRRSAPLLAVILMHAAFFWAFQAGLNPPRIPQPPLPEVIARLIEPSPAPQTMPAITTPQPKREIERTPQPRPVTPRKLETPQRTPMPRDEAPTVAENPVFPSPPVDTSPSQPAPPPVTPAEPLPVSAPRFDAAYLNNPKPLYPPLSRRAGEEGKVVLRVFVNAEGLPTDVQLQGSSGSPRLDEVAIRAVKAWRFVPAKRGQEPVAGWVLVPLDFRLTD